MLLAVDAGNTQTVIGLYSGDDLVSHWRIATNADRSSDEHALLLGQFLAQRSVTFADVDGMVVCSTVPRLTVVLAEMAERYLAAPPVIVGPGVRTGMPILYDNPKEVGADRIANALGAFELAGGPTIVCDFGTATTVDATSARGEYLGGAILPGVEISLDALFDRAAALSRVRLVEPRRAIGKSTVESIQSGAIFGFAGAVDGLCRRFEDELGPCTVLSTGGLGGLIAPYSSCITRHEPWLTLRGLRLVWERNQPPASQP
ncbi:MAG: type III pantothenate kinase [Acidimicrobiales bacterium]